MNIKGLDRGSHDETILFWVLIFKGGVVKLGSTVGVLLAMLLFLGAAPVRAGGPFYVDNTRSDDSGDGVSWATAKKTINGAISIASAGEVIILSGGIDGETYTDEVDITKGVTIRAAVSTDPNYASHNGTVIQARRIKLHNTSGLITLQGFTGSHAEGISSRAMLQYYSGSNTLHLDMKYINSVTSVYGFQYTNTGAKSYAEYRRCWFFNNHRAQTPYYDPRNIASTPYHDVTVKYCKFDYRCGVIGASGVLKIYNCLFLHPESSVFAGAIRRETGADIEVYNTIFAGCKPTENSGGTASATNCRWFTGDTGYFDTETDCTGAPYTFSVMNFVQPKHSIYGGTIVRIDDNGNLGDGWTAAQILNPEAKVCNYVNGHGTTNPLSALEIDYMRRLVNTGNEIGAHGATHAKLCNSKAFNISCSGASPATVTISGTRTNDATDNTLDSTAWDVSLTLTVDGVSEEFNLDIDGPRNTLRRLKDEINGIIINSGTWSASLYDVDSFKGTVASACLADITNGDATGAGLVLEVEEAAFHRFEIVENVLDLEAYINTSKDRNGNYEVAGTTVAAPETPYTVKTYVTAFGLGSAGVETLFGNFAQIIGASKANGGHSDLVLPTNEGSSVGLYTFQYLQVPSDYTLAGYAMAGCFGPDLYQPLWHGKPRYKDSTAELKTLFQTFQCGRTFRDLIQNIRGNATDWTIAEPDFELAGDMANLFHGDFHLRAGSSLIGAGYAVEGATGLDVDFDGKSTNDPPEIGLYAYSPLPVDSDGDGMPDDWEIEHGLNPLADDAGDDPDGDGFTNLDEYQVGLDPHIYDNPVLDFDFDGDVDGGDLRHFADCFLGQDLAADLNGDGDWTTQDIWLFLKKFGPIELQE